MRPMRYMVREKVFSIGTDFWVTDERDNKAFLVDGKVLHIRQTLELKDPSGAVVATIRKKLVAVRETMEIERDGSLLATVHKMLVSPTGASWRRSATSRTRNSRFSPAASRWRGCPGPGSGSGTPTG
jgi:uncharacterized protein YxjI